MDKAQYRARLRELLPVSHLGIIRRLEQLQGVSICITQSNIFIFHRTLNGGEENPGGRNKDITVLVEYFKNSFIWCSLKAILVKVSPLQNFYHFCNAVKLVLWAISICKKRYNFGAGCCFIWHMFMVPGLLHCCLLALLVGGLVVCGGAVMLPGAGFLMGLCWHGFSGVCVSYVLSAGHVSPSIIVVISMLY